MVKRASETLFRRKISAGNIFGGLTGEMMHCGLSTRNSNGMIPAGYTRGYSDASVRHKPADQSDGLSARNSGKGGRTLQLRRREAAPAGREADGCGKLSVSRTQTAGRKVSG
ncbi:hypothetical protein MA16_Dca000713 [Dendrobium catenatum]|uniref:Uncharacterized protein n=1 Tax=Dendrobium catenatum TaxID=906689 RepID=A0A2I0WUM5_9ASPA|nr:hypothetical protein MA16_Dca000713 [Dendrobium catenatum]